MLQSCWNVPSLCGSLHSFSVRFIYTSLSLPSLGQYTPTHKIPFPLISKIKKIYNSYLICLYIIKKPQISTYCRKLTGIHFFLVDYWRKFFFFQTHNGWVSSCVNPSWHGRFPGLVIKIVELFVVRSPPTAMFKYGGLNSSMEHSICMYLIIIFNIFMVSYCESDLKLYLYFYE